MPNTATAGTTRDLTYIQGVTEALRWALETYPEVLVFGEDVAIPGGPYGASRGLWKQFGDRVFDTPISESAILGAAIGAAMRGFRPVVEIMYVDFFLVAFDQIVNQAANVRYVSEGRLTAPVTIRSQQAATLGACAQHSQSLEAFFAHVPGLRLGLPSNPQDAYDMLRSAIVSNDPVVVLENRALYQQRATVLVDGPVEGIGGARLVRAGEDLTVVTWSRMVAEAEAAADALAEEGVSVDLLDLRWLSPLDFESVLRSVERTSRVVIAHEANRTGGFGAEVAARLAAEAFWSLEAPIERVALPDVRMPAAPTLQRALLPDGDAIASAARRVLGA
jgi:pyruvate dehydrogenase E1 component beta subunit/2-oxoisovalerate dehydrogenase E1 component